MNTTTDKKNGAKAEGTGAYRETTLHSLTLHFLDGKQVHWDLALKGRVTLQPAPHATDAMDMITIRFLDDCVATIKGWNLLAIQNGLKQGQGGVIVEQGDRYSALYRARRPEPGQQDRVQEPYVASIDLEEPPE